MSGEEVRRLGPGDVDAFIELRRAGEASDAHFFRSTAADDEAIGRAGWEARLAREYVVGVDGGGGLVARGGFTRLSGSKLDHKGLIWGMYVRPSHRGQGLASAVLEALLAEAATQVRQVLLTLYAANAGARALYERHGFTVYAIEPEAIRDGKVYHDEALMWRRV